jgi:antitoxin ParD1/3/4
VRSLAIGLETQVACLIGGIPRIGIFEKTWQMAKNTSILLGDYFDNFINSQIQSGRFSSASEVVRAALRLFEQEEKQKEALIEELKKGEKSGFVKKFDRQKFIKNLHSKHGNNEL